MSLAGAVRVKAGDCHRAFTIGLPHLDVPVRPARGEVTQRRVPSGVLAVNHTYKTPAAQLLLPLPGPLDLPPLIDEGCERPFQCLSVSG